MPRHVNQEIANAFRSWKEPGKASWMVECKYCGEKRAKNSTRMATHLKSQCAPYRTQVGTAGLMGAAGDPTNGNANGTAGTAVNGGGGAANVNVNDSGPMIVQEYANPTAGDFAGLSSLLPPATRPLPPPLRPPPPQQHRQQHQQHRNRAQAAASAHTQALVNAAVQAHAMGAVTMGMSFFDKNPTMLSKLVSMFTVQNPNTNETTISQQAIDVYTALYNHKIEPNALREILDSYNLKSHSSLEEEFTHTDSAQAQRPPPSSAGGPSNSRQSMQTQRSLPIAPSAPQYFASDIPTGLHARYKLFFTVPNTHLEACKEAVFLEGAGTYPGGKYAKCCFETAGTGQFLPVAEAGAQPTIGTQRDNGSGEYELETVEETRVEVLCVGKGVTAKAVQALRAAHPYEEPAYEVVRIEDL